MSTPATLVGTAGVSGTGGCVETYAPILFLDFLQHGQFVDISQNEIEMNDWTFVTLSRDYSISGIAYNAEAIKSSTTVYAANNDNGNGCPSSPFACDQLLNSATASPPTSNPQESIDSPQPQPEPGNTVAGSLTIAGWAIDQASSSGTGVDRVDIYVDTQAGPGHSAVASISSFGPRPDVVNAYGSQFLNSGYSTTIDINGWANGTHTLYVPNVRLFSGFRRRASRPGQAARVPSGD